MQGLGYVGAAMATAVAHASDEEGNRIYDVVGIDLPDETGRHRVESIKCGDFPFATTDEKLSSALSQAHVAGNITATTDETILSKLEYPEAKILSEYLLVQKRISQLRLQFLHRMNDNIFLP